MAKQKSGDIRIVILHRGWVMVGNFLQDGAQCALENASVVRRWGTTKGLGELAAGGPIDGKTVLDRAGRVDFNELTIVATVRCNPEKWSTHVSV